jgi:serine/threonine protein phosphatase PrpC
VALKGANLVSANLGDSGYLVIRPKANGEVQLVFKSEELQHSFNFPYQLGPQSSDRPDHADIHTMPVQIGDLVILGTDGLFDNFDERQICAVVQAAISASNGDLNLAKLSQTIANEAFKVSQNRRAMSPFAKNALAHGYSYNGGKPDDITVLVSRVSTIGELSHKNSASSGSTNTTTTSGSATNQSANNKFQAQAQEDDDSASPSSTTSMASSILQRIMGLRPWAAASAKL